jgi:hypothetical protein
MLDANDINDNDIKKVVLKRRTDTHRCLVLAANTEAV